MRNLAVAVGLLMSSVTLAFAVPKDHRVDVVLAPSPEAPLSEGIVIADDVTFGHAIQVSMDFCQDSDSARWVHMLYARQADKSGEVLPLCTVPVTFEQIRFADDFNGSAE